jgi:hypothetical protein
LPLLTFLAPLTPHKKGHEMGHIERTDRPKDGPDHVQEDSILLSVARRRVGDRSGAEVASFRS